MFAGVCRFAAALAFVTVTSAAVAQTIPPSEQPGRERERFTPPTPPRAQPGGAAISLPSTVAPAGAENVKIIVRDIRIVGSTVYSADELAALSRELIGRKVSVADIYGLARRITEKYGNDGYVLSRAIVPPQRFNPRGAVVRIDVIEGWVNKVEWPAKLSRYRDFFSDYTAKITSMRPANIRTIERYILLASDLPGLKFSTSLRPSPGVRDASTLVVEVKEKPIDANVRVDNRGTQARGPVQFLASSTLNNLLGLHEALTVSWAATTQLRELEYFAGSYRQVLNSEGLTLVANGSYGYGRPGTSQLEILQYKTKSIYVDVGLSYPVVRLRERNLALTGLFFSSDSQSDILSAVFNLDKLRGMRLRADGDFADRFGGIHQINVAYSQGVKGLGSSDNDNPLASRAAGRVDFGKIEADVSRLQPLFATVSALLAVRGQYATTSLLSPEQCGYGGGRFGRAFDPSQLLGDHCWMALAELRYDVPGAPSVLTQAQVYVFADYGKVFTIAPAAFIAASAEGGSAGAGLRLAWQAWLAADLSAAKAIEGPRDDWRFFFTVTARY